MARAAVGTQRCSAGATLPYLEIFQASPIDRINMIRAGVRASYAKRIAADLRLDQRVVFNALNLKTATVNRKASARAALAPDEGERVLGMAKLLGQVEAMLQGADLPPGFKAAEWLARWLTEPLPAFGGIKPIDMLDTLEGQSLVAQALAQIEAGAYA